MDIVELEKAVREHCKIPDNHSIYLSYDNEEVCFYHSDGYGKLTFGSVKTVDLSVVKETESPREKFEKELLSEKQDVLGGIQIAANCFQTHDFMEIRESAEFKNKGFFLGSHPWEVLKDSDGYYVLVPYS